jgi:hypothetical protein
MDAWLLIACSVQSIYMRAPCIHLQYPPNPLFALRSIFREESIKEFARAF